MDMKTVEKTFLQARIFNADQTKKNLSGPDWAVFFGNFIKAAGESVNPQLGQIVKLTHDGILAVFEDTAQGAQSAINLQEAMEAIPGNYSCAIGVASGQAYEFQLRADGQVDYVGTTMDIVRSLAIRARGNAILLFSPSPNHGENIKIQSKAGESTSRPQMAYFIEQAPIKLPTSTHTVPFCSIFWQAQPTHFLTTSPVEDITEIPVQRDNQSEEQIYFGRVSAFKKERGFGFIQFYTEDQEYNEIYFHMTYVINQTPVQEHDHVQFTIKPGKEGRPQACSVLVMGSRLQGQMESQDKDGSGYITIHNQDFGLIRFFAIPQELKSDSIKVNDVVEFTVGSGSDMEGLVAVDIQNCQEEDPLSEVVGSGDNLQTGSIERAVITVYFVEKGYGFAKCRRNNVYVHVSELASPENIPNPGDIIEFEVFPGRDGTYRANNIRLVMKKGLTL
jgi:cold shock CspA family protein